MTKQDLGEILLKVSLASIIMLCLWMTTYLGWKAYYEYLLNREGEDVVATITWKYNGMAYFDICYDGIYYRDLIHLTKSAYRKTMVGERFRAKILPDKLKYYHEGGIMPNCFKIILVPLPDELQDIEGEQIRIYSMYGYDIIRHQ